jgi:1,4-alpha-glucan branching enzyme
VFERAGLLFVFNFHPTASYNDYRVGVEAAGEYRVVLSSDEKRFGGWDRINTEVSHLTTAMEWNNRKNWMQVSETAEGNGLDQPSLQVYIPSRTCAVFAKSK